MPSLPTCRRRLATVSVLVLVAALAACHGEPAGLRDAVTLPGAIVLPATLRYTVDSVVTLTLDVVNADAAPVELRFSSAQQYDFVVTPLGGGAPLWRWSADRGFATVLTARTLAPGEHWIVTERWQPATRGQFTAHGLITSTSHGVDAVTALTVP